MCVCRERKGIAVVALFGQRAEGHCSGGALPERKGHCSGGEWRGGLQTTVGSMSSRAAVGRIEAKEEVIVRDRWVLAKGVEWRDGSFDGAAYSPARHLCACMQTEGGHSTASGVCQREE